MLEDSFYTKVDQLLLLPCVSCTWNISSIKGKPEKYKQVFDYKSKGMMAQIGKRTGVAILFDKIKLHGFLAWWLWRTYYLINLPTTKKKIKVIGDWTFDFIFKPDVSQIQ